jgi:hypothetical protein
MVSRNAANQALARAFRAVRSLVMAAALADFA